MVSYLAGDDTGDPYTDAGADSVVPAPPYSTEGEKEGDG